MPTPHAAQSRWKARDMAYIAVMAGIMAICAWISIPALVPFTLQTFGLFMALGVLGGGGVPSRCWSTCCWAL